MKTASRLLVLVVLFAASLSLGATSAPSPKAFSVRQLVRQLVDQYYQQKDRARSMTPRNRPPINCDPSGQDCVDAACDKLGHFGCDDLSEVKRVSMACRGNYDGNCLEKVCAKLGAFGCDDLSEIETVARACVGNYGSDCFESVCSRLGAFGCDDLKEVEEVLRTCSGN